MQCDDVHEMQDPEPSVCLDHLLGALYRWRSRRAEAAELAASTWAAGASAAVLVVRPPSAAAAAASAGAQPCVAVATHARSSAPACTQHHRRKGGVSNPVNNLNPVTLCSDPCAARLQRQPRRRLPPHRLPAGRVWSAGVSLVAGPEGHLPQIWRRDVYTGTHVSLGT